jgi:hypothetical protein
MEIDKGHFRRPEGDRRALRARLSGYRRHSGQGVISGPRPHAEAADTDRLVDEAMKAALATEAREDVTFGEYAALFGFFRSAVMQEGRLVELAVEQAVRQDPDLALLPIRAMPIVPAAQEMLKRTPPDQLKGVRVPSRVHATETYRPDLFIVNRTRHSGLILDIKRSFASYRPQEIDRLRFRMLAVAAVAPEWVAEHQHTLLVEVETAIVDGADEVSDPERGVFRLSEIDLLLEIEGAAESISKVRQAFSCRVQAELARRCQVLGKEYPDGLVAESVKRPAEPPSALAVEDNPTVVPLTASGARPRFGYARRPGMP